MACPITDVFVYITVIHDDVDDANYADDVDDDVYDHDDGDECIFDCYATFILSD